MLTTFGFQIAFFSLSALIVVLALGRLVRRKRRQRLLSLRPNEPLDRLDRLQRELQDKQPPPAEQSRDTVSTADALPAIPATTAARADRGHNAESVPVYRSSGSSATTWQDRTLFTPQTQSGWRGSPAIPLVEPHEVPTVDTSDYVYGAATPTLAPSKSLVAIAFLINSMS